MTFIGLNYIENSNKSIVRLLRKFSSLFKVHFGHTHHPRNHHSDYQVYTEDTKSTLHLLCKITFPQN